MVTFDKDSPSTCPQCGNGAGFHYCRNTAPAPVCEDVRGAAPNTPHMHRACFTCTYEWAEEPIV
jgi:hypothetical protein